MNLDFIQITLDGTPKIHDAKRFNKQGNGTFDTIIKNIEMALRAGIRVEVRTNVDADNISNLPELATLLYHLKQNYNNLNPYIYILQDASSKKELFEKYNAIMRFGMYIAIFMSSAFEGYIAENSLDLVYKITILLQFVPIINLAFFVIEPPYKKVDSKEMKIQFAINDIIKNKKILYILLIDVFISVACIPLESHYFNYFLTIGISEKISGFVYGLQYLASSFLGLFLYKPIRKYLNGKVIIYLPPLMMVAIFLFALIPGFVAKSFFYFIALLLLCVFSPVKANLLHQDLDSTYRASSLSLQSLCMALLAFVLQPLFGWISESLGYSLAIEFTSILAFLLLVLNGKLLKKQLAI